MITQNMVRSSTRWLLAMQKEAGTDEAMKCYDVMRAVFGDELASAVLFGIMQHPSGKLSIGIQWTAPYSLHNKIQAIKALRQLTGYGLADAKTAIESCDRQVQYHHVDNSLEDHVYDNLVAELKQCGIEIT